MVLYIFNPEHDLCMAHGDPNYMPPMSALEFGRSGSGYVMQAIYGQEGIFASTLSLCDTPIRWDQIECIVPWGWNVVIKKQLLRYGAPEHLLPSDEWLEWLRSVQHRSHLTECGLWVPIIPTSMHSCWSLEDIEDKLARYGEIVLKAPLSGSGRGLRWIRQQLSDHDREWALKTLRSQGCVMAEKRQKVTADFAWEFQITRQQARFSGYSLFTTQNGVYRGNLMLDDHEILVRLARYIAPDAIQNRMEQTREILQKLLVGRYEGPVGIDLFVYEEQGRYDFQMCEANYRHTMGMAAHEHKGSLANGFIPTTKN